MQKIKHKAFAYITQHNHLLVFRHLHFPEAGIQVPAGTVEEAERVEDAVLREAFEETGLTQLTLDCFLGKQVRDMSDFSRDEIHHRHFYHLRYNGCSLATWIHEESYASEASTQEPLLFEFFWSPLPHGIPPLIADHGIMIPHLLAMLDIARKDEGDGDDLT
jgi:8-oxo-dGTP diphosphatase